MVVDILDQSAAGCFVLFIGERRRGHALELVGQGVALVVEIGVKRLQDRAVASQQAEDETAFDLVKVFDIIEHQVYIEQVARVRCGLCRIHRNLLGRGRIRAIRRAVR